jgi:hypothetical protein
MLIISQIHVHQIYQESLFEELISGSFECQLMPPPKTFSACAWTT